MRLTHRLRATLLAVAGAAGLSGCVVGDRLLGNYTGPLPAKADLVEEAVVIRDLSRDPSGPWAGLVTSAWLDRVSYLEAGKLRSVDRVILAVTRNVAARIDSLDLAVGDTVVVTTRYGNVHRGGTRRGVIPGWPGEGHHDYPSGFHNLIEVRRRE